MKIHANFILFSFLIISFILVFSYLWISHSRVPSDNSVSDPATSAQRQPMDPLYNEQRNILDNIQLESAWDITTGSSDVIVAVIDDAIDINHPDLIDNMMPGFDFVDRDNDPSPETCIGSSVQNGALEGHGTQVAGVIGATGDNAFGIAGINWRVRIMPLRIGCRYSRNAEAEAVEYAIQKGAHIINASYGGPAALGGNQRVVELLKNAEQQVLFVTAAGNQHINNDEIPVYPGSLGLSNVITVAASNEANQLTGWAQYGASSVDVAAPGTGLKSTTLGDGYGDVSGSSFSTAVVSGVAALIKARDFNNSLTAPDLKALLQATVSPVGGQQALTKTAGIVNARAALDLLNLPQPVLTIIRVSYEDKGELIENGLLDDSELGNVIVELENLWDAVLTGNVRVTVSSPAVQLSEDFFNLLPLQAGERFSLSIPIQTTKFNKHERVRFELDIQATSSRKSVSYKRAFELQTGALLDKVEISERIQKNDQDDYHYYHLAIPSDKERVAIELQYATTDTRDMGLLAMFDQRPQIHFRAFNNSPYWYSADYRSDLKTGFERINFIVPAANKGSNLNIMVFNQPGSNATPGFELNKSYQLKSCFYSDTDGNTPPRANAGRDFIVNEGDIVILTGEVSDSDGQITRAFWRSNGNVPFTVLNDLRIRFEARPGSTNSFSLIAIDDGCKQTVDSVKVSVEEITGNEPDGLILNPRTLNIFENSGFEVRVSAVFASKEVSNLIMLSAPEGVMFSDSLLSWPNASPAGVHFINFSTNVGGQRLTGTITVNISERRVGNGGGCVAQKNAAFDPLLLIYVLLSCFFIFNRANVRNKKSIIAWQNKTTPSKKNVFVSHKRTENLD